MKQALTAVILVGIAVIVVPGIATAQKNAGQATPAHETAGAHLEDTSSTAVSRKPDPSKPAPAALAELKKAAKANKYVFAFFHKQDNDQTTAMRTVLNAAMQRAGDRAALLEIDVLSATEKGIVEKFHVKNAPMPLLLAIAPNGAITAGFPYKADVDDLVDALVSPATAQCLKALQDDKLLFLCIQNDRTEQNAEAMQGVRAFERDERFAQDTVVVTLDPADSAEARFLANLQVDPKTKQATTIFFAPPGGRIGTFQGATQLDKLLATLISATSGFG